MGGKIKLSDAFTTTSSEQMTKVRAVTEALQWLTSQENTHAYILSDCEHALQSQNSSDSPTMGRIATIFQDKKYNIHIRA